MAEEKNLIPIPTVKRLPSYLRLLRQAKEEGAQACLIGFGGNDIDYNWRAISEHPEEEHLPNTPPEQFQPSRVRP